MTWYNPNLEPSRPVHDEFDDTEDTEPFDRKSHGMTYKEYDRRVSKKFSSFVAIHETESFYNKDITLSMAVMMISAKRSREKREAQLPEPLEKECQGIVDALNPIFFGNRP